MLPADINVRPLQTQSFTAAQSERQGNHESRPIPHAFGLGKDATRFFDGERYDFLLDNTWRFGYLCGIRRDVLALHRLVERRTNCAVSQVDSSRAKPFPLGFLLLHERVQLLKVFGL
jgi:hypothetical protein